MNPELTGFASGITFFFWHKLLLNLRSIILNELPVLGGSWLSAFFLVGLLVGFRNPATRRVRYFILASIIILAIAQALGRTHLSDMTRELNSENLLVLVTPFFIVYGVSLFFLLLDQIEFPMPQMRHLALGVFGVIACLPMLFVFLPPRPYPISSPPYDPRPFKRFPAG